MCGIVVMLGLGAREADAAVLERMAQSIGHRGPDDSGIYGDGPVGFGFRRPSILDLSPSGHPPMSSHDGQLVTPWDALQLFRAAQFELWHGIHCD